MEISQQLLPKLFIILVKIPIIKNLYP